MTTRTNTNDGTRPRPPRAASKVLQDLERLIRGGEMSALSALPTGFQPLDRFLGGGLRSGDLILIGGAQSVGKTTLALQVARNLAASARAACAYVCYEHEEMHLLQRLIALEAYLSRADARTDPISLGELRELLAGEARPGRRVEDGSIESLARQAGVGEALARVREYGGRLLLLKASGVEDDLGALREVIRALKTKSGTGLVVFVDYLQKMPVFPTPVDELDGITRVTNGLKDLALSEAVPIVAIVAADREGLRAHRLRMHHLRGSAALSYEADVVLILNNKYRVVTKKSITYNPHQAQDFRRWVVCTIEKNRSGPDLVDLEFRAAFASAAFDPVGQVVADTLIEERIEDE